MAVRVDFAYNPTPIARLTQLGPQGGYLRRLPLVVLVACLSLGGLQAPLAYSADRLALAAHEHLDDDPATTTVYITKTGEKYHRGGCSSLRRSQFAVSLKEAVQRGFGPCKICRPPTVGRDSSTRGRDETPSSHADWLNDSAAVEK